MRTLHLGSQAIQSAQRLNDPDNLAVAYTRAMLAALLFTEAHDALLIGIGGGTLARFLHRAWPQGRLTAVDNHPQVVAIAHSLFGLPQPDDRLRIVIDDGVAFLDAHGGLFDLLLIDAFGPDDAPDTMTTVPFFETCCRRLSTAGVLSVNLWRAGRQPRERLLVVREAFAGRVLQLPVPGDDNLVALAFAEGTTIPPLKALAKRAASLQTALGLSFNDFLSGLRAANPHDGEGFTLAV